MKINDILVEFVTPQAVAQDPGLEREKDVDVIFFGKMPRDYAAETAWAALEEVLPAEYPAGSEKAQEKVKEVAFQGGAVVTTKPLSVAKKLVATFNGYGIKSRINGNLNEFAPSGDSGGSGDYFQALASAWYNGTFDSGSLQKGIKSQQDVERLLNRGIVCPDGVTRKYGIDYNSTFDGVVISSDDYYEHADHDETDSRTGKPFGPYDYMEFSDEQLDEATGDEKFDTMMGQIQREPKYPDAQMPPTDVKDLYQWAVKNNKPYHKIFAEWANREGYKSVAPALQRAGDLDTEALDYWTPRVWKIYWGEVRGIDSEMPPEWSKKRVPDELRDYLETVFDAYDNIVFDWPTEYRQIGGQDNYAEGLTEFAADDGNDGGEDDALRNYARMWWAGDEATQMQIERALAKMGWEIGEDEGGYDNGGVFVVRAGDENGNSYQSWAAEDLTEGLTEVDRRGFLKGLGAAAVAGAMALGAGGAHARVGADYVDNPDINRLTGKPKVTQVEPGTEQPVAAVKKGPGFSAEYLKSVIDGTHPRPMISKERAQELLQQQQQTTNEQGVAEGKPKEKEADYGADYQDMVSRVKKLAGLGPLKTVYDPQKRVYKNVPTAVQPKKEQR